jgi:hypothetical protein
MLENQWKCLSESSTMSKGEKRMWIIIAIVAVTVIGVMSTKHLGDDNFIEEEAETVIEDLVEIDLDLHGHPLKGKIDLSPTSREMQDS